ncbi:MAG: SPOR domain-containing protein [Proteobacteria bacterium]|nr:SPOR domain-containing protein [Pseudomonadota bacterium]
MKKRLLGAAVLIALAVIFVPMLLPSHSDSGQQSVSVKIPPEPSGELQTRILKVGPDSAAAGSSTAVAIHDPDHVATLDLEKNPAARQAAETLPIAATHAEVASAASAPAAVAAPVSGPAPTVAKAPATSAQEAAVPPKPEPAAKAEPIAGGPGVAAGGIYTVNLGIYADHASANKLVASAKQHGFTALATPETFQGKSVLRVRVGPFASRAQAEAARLKLKDFEHVSMTVDAGAVNQTGDAPASAIAAGQPGSWAVQLAAFGSEAAANQLRDRLRGQGFDGYVDSMNTAKGKLWRVRAGPFASREVAATTRDQIAQKLKVKGDIVTQ